MKKIISFLLILATLISCFTVTTVPVFAATGSTETPGAEDYMEILKGEYNRQYEDGISFVKGQAHMKLMARYGGYELYCNPYTGEVAYVNQATQQVLTTNPYDFTKLIQNMGGAPDPTKNTTFSKLLSQIEISFVDNESKVQTFTSFVEAAARNQIVVKYMKNGLRVEYTMGRLNTAYLLPGVVLEKDFRENIINPILDLLEEIEMNLGMDSEAYEEANAALMTLEAWYLPFNYEDPDLDAASRDALAQEYPIFKPESEGGQGATLYCLDESSEQGMKDTERVRLENLLKSYCPDLDHELLDEMHAQTGYRPDVNETPVFRAALEYVLEDDGLSIRMPASSIRFDETKYTLQYVKILQFFGAGNLDNDGYVFYPDGSGAIVEFREFYNSSNREAFTLSGTVYGEDFAYYDIDQNAKHSETIRVPVFGIVEEKKGSDCGFFAILEDGDALADIATYFGGGEFSYATAYPMVYPRPSDAYNLSEAISVADNKEMTIVSDKKYTGFYELKYMMLFDEEKLTKADTETAKRYIASYSGMAAAYRDYLVAKGTLKPLVETSVQNGKLPLYIETLGSIETVKKILSIPVNVDVPLASFEDIKTMYTQLEKKNITNINFKLTGYANGGLNGVYPEKVKWLGAVGGKKGFADLQEFASEKGFGVYPEFNFSYASYDSGVSLKKHASRAVDDRYCSKQLYNPVYQQFESYFDICISPSSIVDLVAEFSESYSKFEPMGISVSTLGSDLNSDFNKDAPLNRQDAEDYIKESLALLDEKYQSVMADGGNIYSVEYLDHILDLPLDASNYKYESKSVPFLGMVLHGYVNYAGTVINEAGDSSFQLLKSIENGALLYYMLIYQNSSLLKEDEELSKYYSVRFDIWFNSIVDQYEMLNGAIGDLQLYNIVEHDFIIGERTPTEAELEETMAAFNELLLLDLTRQYKNLIVAKRREMRVKRIAQELITAGENTQENLEARLAYVLGEELTNTDKEDIAECLESFQNGVPFENLYGKIATVAIDRAKLEEEIAKRTGEALTDDQSALLDAFVADYCTENPDAYTVIIDTLSDNVKKKSNQTASHAQMGDAYEITDYTDNSGRIVLVTYGKGDERVHFVLNYNTYDVNVRLDGVNGNEVFKVPSYGFRRINGTVLAD